MATKFFTKNNDVEEAFDLVSNMLNEHDCQIQDVEKALGSIRDMVKQCLSTGEYGKNNTKGWLFPDTATAKDFGFALLDLANKGFSERFIEDGGRKNLTSSGTAGGGFLLPEKILQAVLDLMATYGKFRANATVIQGIANRATIPNLASLPTVYAPGEAKAINTSEPKFTSVGFDPIKLAILTAFSREIEEDAIVSIAELVLRTMIKAMAMTEDACGFVGDESDTFFKFLGIVPALRGVDADVANIAGLHEQAVAGAYSALTLDDFEAVVSLLPEHFDDNAKWYTTKRFFWQVIHKLARAAGATDMSSILTSDKKRYFMGYEVVFVPFMNYGTLTAHIPAILGDLGSGAYLGEARQLMVETSREALFSSDMTAMKCTERISINTKAGVGSTTEAGPIVGLITNPE